MQEHAGKQKPAKQQAPNEIKNPIAAPEAASQTKPSTTYLQLALRKPLQAKQIHLTEPAEPTAPVSVDEVLHSPGQPLDAATRAQMEPRFGHDFSNVRVHSNAAAAQSASEVNAQAYTVGQNIVFGPARYAPGTDQGRHLLAHELTHVVQQTGPAKSSSPAAPDGNVETENAVMPAARPVHVAENGKLGLARQPADNPTLESYRPKSLNQSLLKNEESLSDGALQREINSIELWLSLNPFGAESDHLQTELEALQLEGRRRARNATQSADSPGTESAEDESSPFYVPPYLHHLGKRLQIMVDRDIKFFALEIAPLDELTLKYPRSPLREDVILEIPETDWENPFPLEERPHGRFQLNSLLAGGYRLLDYHPPNVIIARDGIGYVLSDSIFAWKFGEDFPELYEAFVAPMRYRHDNPGKTLLAEIGISAIPIPYDPQHALAFMAMFVMPFLPGFAEFGAVRPSEPLFRPEADLVAADVEASPGLATRTSPAKGHAPPVVESTAPTAILPDGRAIPPDTYGGGYYGTDIPMDLSTGFPARGNDWRLAEHAMQTGNSAFRGTTNVVSDPVRQQGAAYWAGEGGYVYEIRGVPTWDLNKNLQGRVKTPEGFGGNIMHGEGEYVIPGEVSPNKVVRYGRVEADKQGRLYVPNWLKPGATE
jgi:hypothetical protein